MDDRKRENKLVNNQKANAQLKNRKQDPTATLVTRYALLEKKRFPKKEVSEAYEHFEEIRLNSQEISDQLKGSVINRMRGLTSNEKIQYEAQLFNRGWAHTLHNVGNIYRYFQKVDSEQNCKKIVVLCSKESRKRVQKNAKAIKEYAPRAKRMQKEVFGYWKKKDRELNELKKRKEKLVNEWKKKEEEKRESETHKKRLEFLMRQSDIYAHFMAKKLGIHENSEDAEKKGDREKLSKIQKEQSEAIEIDNAEAFQNISAMINEQRSDLKEFDVGAQKIVTSDEVQQSYQPFDFSNVNIEEKSYLVKSPTNFYGDLKEYQLKGLRWLDNLYEQGINGILADEMGLGKTIQSIALLCHISETKGNWGPFLVVAPASTLYNWKNEIQRFGPNLKVLPYWGQQKERKVIRKYFSQMNVGRKDSPFHVVVTSYHIAVQDEKSFHRVKWQYIILDEAQAIKNINSQRWKILLSFKSRNKLLLTGTPIQNTMAELWALLHFIMPKLFDSHDQFQEWFSKDIEAHSQDQKSLNQIQLNRLHSILKPFMLRRVKKDVEKELGKKQEFHILCELTKRQKDLYNQLKAKLSVTDFFTMLESKTKVKNLMNLVMQFRKVCNHPELFERTQITSSYVLNENMPLARNTAPQYGHLKTFWCNWLSPLQLVIPQIFYYEVMDQPRYSETLQWKKFHRRNCPESKPKNIPNALFFHSETMVTLHTEDPNSKLFDFVG
jgi:DNA helicase INO80